MSAKPYDGEAYGHGECAAEMERLRAKLVDQDRATDTALYAEVVYLRAENERLRAESLSDIPTVDVSVYDPLRARVAELEVELIAQRENEHAVMGDLLRTRDRVSELEADHTGTIIHYDTIDAAQEVIKLREQRASTAVKHAQAVAMLDRDYRAKTARVAALEAALSVAVKSLKYIAMRNDSETEGWMEAESALEKIAALANDGGA